MTGILHATAAAPMRLPLQARLFPRVAVSWLALALLPLLPWSPPALAEEKANTTFSGFGTIGLVYDNDDEVGFARDNSQKNRPEYDVGWRPDTRLGLLATHQFNPFFRITGEMVLNDEVDISIDSIITRAFACWQPVADLSLRVGRMGDATFLMSEYRDAGYAYPWARPPETSYSLISVQSYDGVELAYKWMNGDASWRIKGLYGSFRASIPVKEDNTSFALDGDDLVGAALIREQGPWKVWLGYSTFRFTNEIPITSQVRRQLETFAAAPGNPYADEARALGEALNWIGLRNSYGSLGMAYDDGRWVWQSEIGLLDSSRKTFAHGQIAYASLGRRFGSFLPYVLVGTFQGGDAVTAAGGWSTLGEPYGNLQKGALALATAALVDQDMAGGGVRWDFHTQADLKLQWTRMFVEGNGGRLWAPPAPAQDQSREVDVVSLTLDFVF